jgi:hypothetical protein
MTGLPPRARARVSLGRYVVGAGRQEAGMVISEKLILTHLHLRGVGASPIKLVRFHSFIQSGGYLGPLAKTNKPIKFGIKTKEKHAKF